VGLFNWENTIPAQNETDTTLVVGQEDAAGGQPWIYVGQKQREGNAFDKAGLTNGADFVLELKVHKSHPNPELVEYGQLLALYVRDFDDVYTISD
jgi:hypothetical protein